VLEEIIIKRKSGVVAIDFKEIWRYRELFWFLTWRDILVKYKQTIIGILWAFIRPFLTMVVFSFIFGRVAKLPSEGIPYPLLTIAGLLPWQLFANAVSESSNSLVGNANMISKIYFPRLIIPASSVLSGLIDFLISFGILIALFIWYGFIPSANLFYLPVFAVLAFVSALGAGLWFSALNVEYRDVRFVVPFLIQMGVYISPVGFSSQIVPGRLRFIYSLNPMVGVIDGFRWSLLGDKFQIYWPGLGLSCGVVLLLLISGAYYFRKTERTFADVI
jgi:lipopolysaccharide transport system permease protein